MKVRLVRADGRQAEVDHVPLERTLIVLEGERRLVFRRTGWVYSVRDDGEAVAVGATFVEVAASR